MIVEGIINVLLAPFMWLINLIPDVSLSMTMIDTALDYIKVACYFLPMGTVLVILKIVLAIVGFKIAISLVKTLWDILPLV